MTDYELVKVSLDAYVQKLADELARDYVNLESSVSKEQLDGPDELVVAKLLKFNDAPRPPLYTAEFVVGIKVHENVNGYVALDLLKVVKERFGMEMEIPVGDFGTQGNPPLDGYMVVVRSSIEEAAYEGLNIVQVIHVVARCMVYAG